jgi:hypothetical protein
LLSFAMDAATRTRKRLIYRAIFEAGGDTGFSLVDSVPVTIGQVGSVVDGHRMLSSSSANRVRPPYPHPMDDPQPGCFVYL